MNEQSVEAIVGALEAMASATGDRPRWAATIEAAEELLYWIAAPETMDEASRDPAAGAGPSTDGEDAAAEQLFAATEEAKEQE